MQPVTPLLSWQTSCISKKHLQSFGRRILPAAGYHRSRHNDKYKAITLTIISPKSQLMNNIVSIMNFLRIIYIWFTIKYYASWYIYTMLFQLLWFWDDIYFITAWLLARQIIYYHHTIFVNTTQAQDYLSSHAIDAIPQIIICVLCWLVIEAARANYFDSQPTISGHRVTKISHYNHFASFEKYHIGCYVLI